MISSPESEVKVLVPMSHPANQRGVFSHPSLSLHSVRPHRLITAMIFNPERTKHRGSLLKHGLLGPLLQCLTQQVCVESGNLHV